MASPPCPGSAHRPLPTSSSIGPFSSFPAADPSLRNHHLPGGDSDGGGSSVDEFNEEEDEDEDVELVDRAARSSQPRRASPESPQGE